MQVTVLGCSGGIGGDLRTTALLVDDDMLIDAGTGVGDLTLAELTRINHVFLTHAHLDHIAALPLLVDTVGSRRQHPLRVYATEATLWVLRTHVFNWMIWPDFTRIPDDDTAFLRFETIRVGVTVQIDDRALTAIPANHVVPTVGYRLDSPTGTLIFSGDTATNDALWEAANAAAHLRYLIVETAFPDADQAIATASKHLHPGTLAQELAKLRQPAEVYVTHFKPGRDESIMRDIAAVMTNVQPKMLRRGDVFEF
jgi:ribonuclease BN (tRNA processing enzyme)